MQHVMSSETQPFQSLQEIQLRIDFLCTEIRTLENKLSSLKRDVKSDIRLTNAADLRRKWRTLVSSLSDIALRADTLDTTEPMRHS